MKVLTSQKIVFHASITAEKLGLLTLNNAFSLKLELLVFQPSKYSRKHYTAFLSPETLVTELCIALGWSGRPSGNYNWLISYEPMMWRGQMEEHSISLLPALQELPVQYVHIKVPVSFQEDLVGFRKVCHRNCLSSAAFSPGSVHWR